MRMLKTLAAIIFAVALPCLAMAQTSPNLTYNQVPTPAQWNSYFASKQDYLGSPACATGGCVFSGPLTTAPSTTINAGFSILPGTAPTSPINGNMWATSLGLYVQINGATIGPLASTSSAVSQEINLNSAPLQSPQTGTILQMGNANGVMARAELDAFANVGVYSCVRADGTAASPTAVQANDELCSLNGWGYNGTAFAGGAARMSIFAAQNWSVGAQGSYIRFSTTANGSTTLTDRLNIENDGGVWIGNPTGGSEGVGTLNLAGALYNNGTAPTGTGGYARAVSPSLVTPNIGAAIATTINGNTIAAGSGTLTLGANTASLAGNLTTAGAVSFSGAFGFTGTLTGATNVTFPTSGVLISSTSAVGTDQNSLNAQTANYTVATTDCGSRIQAGTGTTGLFTITLPAVTGFAANCRVSLVNGDTGRGKKLSGFPSPAPSILWPKQEIDVAIVNGAWAVIALPKRWRQVAAVTVNVDPVNGNDSNDGLATGAGNALLTRQKAWDTAADNFDLAGQTLTIQYSDGTYTDNFFTTKPMIGAIGPAGVIIKGNTATPANVVISTTSASAFSFGVNNGSNEEGGVVVAYVKDMRLKTTTSGHGIEVAGAGVNVLWDNIDFNAIAGYDVDVGFNGYVANAGAVSVPGALGAFTISGNATGFALVAEGAQLTTHGSTLTCSGSPAFTTFVTEASGGRAFMAGMTFTSCGTLTGKRFDITSNAILHTLASLTYLPGNAAGTAGSGGMYLGTTTQDGAWTPTLIGSTSGGWTLSTAVGSYELTGRMLTARFTIFASASSSPVGNIQIGGLPFPAVNVVNDGGACFFNQLGGMTNSTSFTTFAGSVSPNTSVIGVLENGSGQTLQSAAVARASATPILTGVCNYRIF